MRVCNRRTSKRFVNRTIFAWQLSNNPNNNHILTALRYAIFISIEFDEISNNGHSLHETIGEKLNASVIHEFSNRISNLFAQNKKKIDWWILIIGAHLLKTNKQILCHCNAAEKKEHHQKFNSVSVLQHLCWNMNRATFYTNIQSIIKS